MATGRLGIANITNSSLTTAYEVPADFFAVVSINIVNRLNTPQTIRLAAASIASPTDAEWLEYDVEIDAKGVIERTGIILAATQKLVVRASTGQVSVVVFGIETPTA
jgi:hypothetical protein